MSSVSKELKQTKCCSIKSGGFLLQIWQLLPNVCSLLQVIDHSMSFREFALHWDFSHLVGDRIRQLDVGRNALWKRNLQRQIGATESQCAFKQSPLSEVPSGKENSVVETKQFFR